MKKIVIILTTLIAIVGCQTRIKPLTDLDDNLKLGELDGAIPPRPAGEVYIDVRFSYDINGLLEVDISNSEFNISRSQTFRHNSINLSETEIQASRERLAALKVHPREQQENRYLLEKGRRLYE